MSKHLFRDSLQKLVFPWLTPHPTSTGPTVGEFEKVINASAYLEVAKRNQVGHNIIFTVAQDAIIGGFRCVDPKGELLEDFDAKVQKLYETEMKKPLLVGYARARLYGSAGIFIGFDDTEDLEKERKYGSKIDYLYALPERNIAKRNAKKNKMGQNTFPLELDNYLVSGTTNSRIDASRLVHLQPFSIEDDLEGTPALEPVYDLLTVLKNADWSVGQNIFRNAGGLTFIVPGDGAKQPQIDAIDDLMANVNTKTVVTLTPGCSTTSGSQGSMDPTSTYNVMMSQISAGCNIPVSILTGAQSGQGVSENDRRDYADFLHGLQINDLNKPVRSMIELFQSSGQLPKTEFKIEWNLRSIFLIEASRAKLYDARTDVEKVKGKEVEARAALYRARAKYWRDLSEREKERFELEEEDRLLEEEKEESESVKGESEGGD